VAEEDLTPEERATRPSRLAAALDFVSDLGVLAFATWTLIAYGGMLAGAKATLLVIVWFATAPFLVALLILLSRRGVAPPAPEKAPDRRVTPPSRHGRVLLLAGLAAGFIAAIIAAAAEDAPWVLVWLGAFVAVAAAVAMGRLRSEGPTHRLTPVAWPAHAFAAAVGFAFGVMSLFINRPSGDDTFYVNRATGTAQLNRIPIRDIIFTDERLPPLSGTGLPVDTFSALQGALARLVDVHAASVVYLLTPPLMTFLATWALWRLLRSWAPRNLLLCFALGCVYWLFSAQGQLTSGSFFLSRMWQGKVILAAWLVMTAYVFMTRWLASRDALTAVLLVAAGVGSIGMASSAAFVAPLLFATAGVPLVASRIWRGLPVLIVAATFPLVVGLVAAQKYSLIEPFQLAEKITRQRGAERGTFWSIGTSWYFHEVFGVGLLAAVGLIALIAAPWLARSGPPARLAAGIAVVSILLLAPAVLPALNHVTDLTTVLRRALWIIPFPAMVGLLGAVPLLDLSRRLARAPAAQRLPAAAAPAVLVAALLVAFGHPLWSSWRSGDSLWSKRIAWKMSPRPLASARAILRRYDGSEPILTEEPIMHSIGLITVRPKAVNPRSFYARLMPERRDRTRDRLALTRFVEEEGPIPSRAQVESALSELRVGLVCVDNSRLTVIREVEDIGYREAFRLKRLVCLQRGTSV
jgi:hypothetical protein